MNAQRGFSIVEMLLAAAFLTVVGFASLGVLAQIARAANGGYASARGASDFDRSVEALRGEAAGAFAVFVPARGAAEVDFYSKTDAGRDVFWRYAFDPATHTLQRADYDRSGDTGVRDPQTGTIDPHASYPPLPNVAAFSAQTLPVSDLGSARNVYGALERPLVAGAHALPVSFDNGVAQRPDLYGGNTLVQLSLSNGMTTRTLHLLTGVMPTGFTYHALPVAHGVVYRIDQTHRFWFGLAQVSHSWIDGRVDVSYDGWRTRTTWCDFNIYGGAHGVDPRSPQASYDPQDYNESFAGLLAQTQSDPQCGPSPPGPAAPNGGSAFSPPPDIVDSPPPCFTAPAPGRARCWPPQAPPNWAPSPLPPDRPPPAWCDAHAGSAACRGRGL